jgi:hypothetical protein
MDFEAIKLPLALFLVALVLLATGLVFYRSLTRNNAQSARLVVGQTYLLVRAVIAVLTLLVVIGAVSWIASLFKR